MNDRIDSPEKRPESSDRLGDRSVNVTDGRLLAPLLVLAAPIILSYSLDIVYYIVDLYWIGYLGTDAVAAMAYSWPVVFLVISVGFGITTAGTVLVAQTKGANQPTESRRIAGQTVTFVTGLSIALAIAGYVLAPTLVTAIGATPGTQPHSLAVQYTRVSFLGMTPVFWFLAFDAIARGWGDTRTPLNLMVLSVAVNLVIDPFFIHGFTANPVLVWLGLDGLASPLYLATGFEGWGVVGAAIATVLSRAIAGCLGLYLLASGSVGITIGRGDVVVDRSTIARLVDIGFPTSIEMGLRSAGIVILTAIIAFEGDTAVAAYGISEYLAALVFLPALGLARGTETVVGQNLGAGQPERARRAVIMGGGMIAVVLAVVIAAAYPYAETLVAFFLADGTDGPEATAVIAIGAAYVWIVGPAYVLYGVFQIVLGAFRGSGHTRLALVFATTEMWLLRIPLSFVFLLWLDKGILGVWYAFTVSFVATTVLTIGWFLRGTWRDPPQS